MVLAALAESVIALLKRTVEDVPERSVAMTELRPGSSRPTADGNERPIAPEHSA